jgi:hypothetical protein
MMNILHLNREFFSRSLNYSNTAACDVVSMMLTSLGIPGAKAACFDNT